MMRAGHVRYKSRETSLPDELSVRRNGLEAIMKRSVGFRASLDAPLMPRNHGM